MLTRQPAPTSALTLGTHTITAEFTVRHNYAGSTGTLSPDQQVNCPNAITVSNNSDSGAGSLRQAIADVCSGGTIKFNGDHDITPISTLDIDEDMTIDGSGHTIIQRGQRGRRVQRQFRHYLHLQALTVANGDTSDNGGGLDNEGGTLNVTGSTFSGNSAKDGGGIYNTGTLTVNTSTFSENSANETSAATSNGNGGGIYNTGTMTVTNSTFSGNSATDSATGPSPYGSGGAIMDDGTMVVTNSTFSGNSANYYGGGIRCRRRRHDQDE